MSVCVSVLLPAHLKRLNSLPSLFLYFKYFKIINNVFLWGYVLIFYWLKPYKYIKEQKLKLCAGCRRRPTKAHPPSVDLRYGEKLSISPSTLVVAATKS